MGNGNKVITKPKDILDPDIRKMLESLRLSEKDKRILKKLFMQQKQVRSHYLASGFCLLVGSLAIVVSIKSGTEDYVWALLICIMSLSYFVNIRRDSRLAKIIKKIIENDISIRTQAD